MHIITLIELNENLYYFFQELIRIAVFFLNMKQEVHYIFLNICLCGFSLNSLTLKLFSRFCDI